jgi:hypothetical protein
VAVSRGAEHHAQKKSRHAAEQDRPDVAEKRRAFSRRQPSLDPRHLVFVDETPALAAAGSGPLPIWRAVRGARRVAYNCWRRCRTGIGK